MINSILIPYYQTTPVSKEGAQKTYTALGDKIWKQFIDGKHHVYGPYVYDEGTHDPAREKKESGYRESALKTVEFVKEHFCEQATLSFYKELNRTACQHFKGRANFTLISAAETDARRN